MTDTTLLPMLRAAEEWILKTPHGDNCFVSDHYEGDPGNRCNCGKESIEHAIAEALESADASPSVHRQASAGQEGGFDAWALKRGWDITYDEKGRATDYTVGIARTAWDAALSTAEPESGWPIASKKESASGWTLDYKFLERVTSLAASRTEFTTSLEATEQVLIAAREVRAAAPTAGETL